MSTLYQEIKVYKRLDERTCVRYCCWLDLRNGKYGVQSADFFRLPVDDQQRQDLDVQLVELFIESEPQERCQWFDSLDAAVAAHDKEFT